VSGLELLVVGYSSRVFMLLKLVSTARTPRGHLFLQEGFVGSGVNVLSLHKYCSAVPSLKTLSLNSSICVVNWSC